MQMVGWKLPAQIAELFGFGLARWFAQTKPCLVQCFGAFSQVARAARRDNILPACDAPTGAWDNMVKRQITPCTAVLTAKFVPQK